MFWPIRKFKFHKSKCYENEKEISPKQDSPERDTRIQYLKQLSNVGKLETYEMTKRKIEIQRSNLRSNKLKIDSISKLFKESLLNKIIPFWEGTEWSFEGHTSEPKSGKIACGYFVSTTLQDIGLNLNRYKFAQQSPINEAKSLALNTEVKEISGELTSENISEIRKYLKEGIHFIGFDESHVGYILKEHNDLYLIHSNYINAAGVGIEQIEKSEVFSSYRKFYIVELSTNERLLYCWKNQKQIEIIKK
ncbi:MAG: hypothetical protein IPN20_25105 [Haliscomenobacter sp.]|nr:hypothetical protein [Haliscomenobacter sp.]